MATNGDIDAIRAQLAGRNGDGLWKSLEELSQSPQFPAFLERDLPRLAPLWRAPVNRRDALRLIGASLALSGLAGCGRPPPERILPYVEQPERVVPGKPLFYATSLTHAGYARGALVETHMGRPTKVEGNPAHPASLGATDIFMQAAVLDLYDPDRSPAVRRHGSISTWTVFLAEVADLRARLRRVDGAGLRILTGAHSSPTLAAQLGALSAQFPEARRHVHEPGARDAPRRGARSVFGQAFDTIYRLDRARVIVSLDGDFLAGMPGCLAYARQFADLRRAARIADAGRMSRLYAAEATPTLTGAMADRRIGLPARSIGALAHALAAELGIASPAAAGTLPEAARSWLRDAARDLLANAGAAAVIPGDQQPPAVHALVQRINERLGNTGRAVLHIDTVAAPADRAGTLAELVEDMAAGQVTALVVLDCNPAYTSPLAPELARLLDRLPFSAHFGLYVDETARHCAWHVPARHELESWSDARAYDGTASLVQPLITPLYAGVDRLGFVAALAGELETGAHDILQRYWRTRRGAGGFERWWRSSLERGVIEGSAFAIRSPALRGAVEELPPSPESSAGYELQVRLDPGVWDGRYANNAWLQELPKPLTKLTWDNAAMLAPADAAALGVARGDLLLLKIGDTAVEAPAWPLPGQPRGSIAVHLGYGRTQAGGIGSGRGFDAYPLLAPDGGVPWLREGITVQATGRRMPLATTQHHHDMEGRDLVRRMTLEAFRRDPRQLEQDATAQPPAESLYPPYDYSDNRAWAMVIDLNACIGCSACVVACQAENSSPVVGKHEVLRGHEMHWLRVDRYYEGTADEPRTLFQPVPCMHCEKAPCEYVCPVGATVHDSEGLNVMVYNRCIGTRDCSQNCPYKVRRFNWLDYTYDQERRGTLAALRNPDVSVRSRGVMEKCTYCVQRISAARIDAKKEGRPIGDGEVVTACQGACPTRAIVFGDRNDPGSGVARARANPLNYTLLAELNTRPRTTYLARVRNPGSDAGGASPADGDDGATGDGDADE
ncbi:MAG TPA: TAT-variant-translocated molybdopterin oxidoreductase [Woeseiaceae bacterium]|nr:TAT-variant-translocated molybdopterin oxidoreductase [Woeseiaceae bacterium]